MDDDPEVIRSQMDQTRSDLTEKLESLETRVAEGMQTTGAVVSDTMTSVRGAVQSVSESLDFRLQVQRHPWLAVGGSLAVGFLAGRLTAPQSGRPSLPAHAPAGQPGTNPSRTDRNQAGSGLLNAVMGVVRDLGAQSLPLVLEYILHPQRESDPPQPMIVPIASAPTTLPLSSKPTPVSHEPRTRRFF